jgi:hypothetical protein
MAQTYLSVLEVRHIIESVKVEKYRYALMYQFLVGASISEVCGVNAPKGNDAIRVSFQMDDFDYPAVLFIIQNKKPKYREKFRVCALPLDHQYEPWAKDILNWFEKNKDKKPFNYSKKSLSNQVKKAFQGYFWLKPEYPRGSEDTLASKKQFRSEEIREMRKQNLKEFYYFSDVDLALFGAWIEPVSSARTKVEIEKVLSTEIDVEDITSMKERAKRYFGKLLRYYDDLGTEIEPLHRQLRIGADLGRARERAFNIIELVENIDGMGQWHYNANFFNENMRLIYEILSDCKDKTDFTSKIANLSPLFEVDLKPLKIQVSKPEGKGSIKLIRDILIENKINFPQDMIVTWFNIQELRTMIIHSKINPKRYLELLIYFGQPAKLNPNYSSLWDNILDKFIISLKQFLDILNNLPNEKDLTS